MSKLYEEAEEEINESEYPGKSTLGREAYLKGRFGNKAVEKIRKLRATALGSKYPKDVRDMMRERDKALLRKEEVNPFQFTGKGKMDVRDDAVRDNINTLLTGALMSCTITPYIALEKVRKVLSYYHINIPGTSFMEGDRGIKVFDVEQFGLKYGMKNDGQIVNLSSVEKDETHGPHTGGENFNSMMTPGTQETDEKYHIYFEYKMNEKGMFDVFSEIVTDSELEDLLNDAEEDINDDGMEDDREEKLNEAKRSAVKIINEVIKYDLDGTSGKNQNGNKIVNPVERRSDRGKYTNMINKPHIPDRSTVGRLENLPHIPDRSTVGRLENKPHIPDRSTVGRLENKPHIPDRSTVGRLENLPHIPDRSTVGRLENLPHIPDRSTVGRLENKPHIPDSSDKSSNFTKPGGDGPPPGSDPFKGVTPRRRGDPGYGELPSGPNSIHSSTPIPSTGYTLPDKKQQPAQMQETSHESVNHVRRLAMKHKRNDR
jgi:hypothetical protein